LADVRAQSFFGVEWYQVVGSSILFNLIINSVVPHMVLAATSSVTSFKAWFVGYFELAPTQSSLNRLYAKRSSFNLEGRYAFVLTTVFICNSFSHVMPIMPWLACFCFTLLYRIDKNNIVNYYTDVAEKKYGAQMAHAAAHLFPGSCLLHCLVGIVLGELTA